MKTAFFVVAVEVLWRSVALNEPTLVKIHHPLAVTLSEALQPALQSTYCMLVASRHSSDLLFQVFLKGLLNGAASF